MSVIDTQQEKEIQQIPVGPTPRGMKIDPQEDTLYITNFSRTSSPMMQKSMNSLSVVDLNSKKSIGTIKTGLGPCSISIYDPTCYQNKKQQKDHQSISL
ncbi:YncE family protein [Seinonella peptonophila]|uniref:YncE family protein n=1 Tax=Seinonella peptonophila TaxID=112248 RepID=UPI00093216F6|nr:hypothetical protein [Seinonella peptonophila]